MKENRSYIATMLTQLRKKNGLRQSDVAELLNVCRSTYSYYESGKTEPNFKMLCNLAKIFGVDIHTFLSDDRDKMVLRESDAASSHTLRDLKKPPKTMRDLSSEERKIIAALRVATPKTKRKAFNVLFDDKDKNN